MRPPSKGPAPRRAARPAPPGGRKALLEQVCALCPDLIARGAPIVRTPRGYAHPSCVEARYGE